jgi:hypothetical protein
LSQVALGGFELLDRSRQSLLVVVVMRSLDRPDHLLKRRCFGRLP